METYMIIVYCRHMISVSTVNQKPLYVATCLKYLIVEPTGYIAR